MAAEIHFMDPSWFHGHINAARILGILRNPCQIHLGHFFRIDEPNRCRYPVHFRRQANSPILRALYQGSQGLNNYLCIHSTSGADFHNLHNQLLRIYKRVRRVPSRQLNCLDLPSPLCLNLLHITTPTQGRLRFHMDGFFPEPQKPRYPSGLPIDELLRAY